MDNIKSKGDLEKELPFITAMIVVRNEENYIAKCLHSLLEQTYPAECYEILIIDGKSEDDTIEIAKQTEIEYLKSGKRRITVRYFTNENKKLASGWNIGIRLAKGDYITRLDAHGYAMKDFLEKSVYTILSKTDCVCVGGIAKSMANTAEGQLISKILSSPFGVGNAKFRYSDKAGYVDTVGHGLYKKSLFLKVGYFDETLDRNQDNDMHNRIRRIGGKFYYNPEIQTVYYNRESIGALLKQGYLNGKWGFYMSKSGNHAMSIRHMVPFLFVLSMLMSFLLGIKNVLFKVVIGVIISSHFLLGIYFALKQTHKIKEYIWMPFIFFAYHFMYGIGSFIGIMKKE